MSVADLSCLSTFIDIVVPERLITNLLATSTGDSSFTVTATVPSMVNDFNALAIYSTITPAHDKAILVNYPVSSQQFSVTFNGLTAGTTYTYIIRIVLKMSPDTVIGLPVMGSYIIPAQSGEVFTTEVTPIGYLY